MRFGMSDGAKTALIAFGLPAVPLERPSRTEHWALFGGFC